MNKGREVFKHFNNQSESAKEHKIRLSSFLSDDGHAVLAIESIQNSGKTTSLINLFAESEDAVLLTQSNDKIDELSKQIRNRYPDLKYRVFYGLERTCDTYLLNPDIHGYVAELRRIGILTKDIHRLICNLKDCGYSTQETDMKGRIIETISRFQYQIMLGRQYHDLHRGRIILMDEADGLLNSEKTAILEVPYPNEKIFDGNANLPKIYSINAPEGTKKTLMDKYKALIKNIDGNENLIRNTMELISLITDGYFTKEREVISELPPIYFIFQRALERQMKVIIGSASWRNHRINFNTAKDYFRLALELTIDKTVQMAISDGISENKLSWLIELDEYLKNLQPEILEFQANFIPKDQFLYYLPNGHHSFSLNHYKRAFNGKDVELRREVWKEINLELDLAVEFYRRLSGKEPSKILLITFSVVENEIQRYMHNLKRSRHGNRDNLFRKMVIKRFFSNKMHGRNENEESFDLIITMGDPLDKKTAEYAEGLGLVKLTKRGFEIRNETDISLKREIFRTVLSELLEAFHRGRSQIPIVAIGNFLAQSAQYQPDNKAILDEITEENGFTLKSLYRYILEYHKQNANKTENQKENFNSPDPLIEKVRLFLSK